MPDELFHAIIVFLLANSGNIVLTILLILCLLLVIDK